MKVHENLTVKVFKASFKLYFLTWIGLNVVAFLALKFIPKKEYPDWAFLAFAFTSGAYYFLTINRSPWQIHLNKDIGFLRISYAIPSFKRDVIVNLNELQLEFQKKLAGRTGKVRTLTIIHDKKILCKIQPTYTGWSESVLSDLSKALNASKIPNE